MAPPQQPDPNPLSGRFPFATDPAVAPLSLLFGVSGRAAFAEVSAEELRVRFGVWRLRTPMANVEGAEVTGPYSLLKVAGPPRLSLVDRGLTLATTTRRGVCVRFRDPVQTAPPWRPGGHTAVTLTVEDPDTLAALLNRAKSG